MCTDVYGMYMYICEHAYVWDEQKGEGGKTPGCRLTVGRLRVLKPFPTARPLPASPQPSLHPPPPWFGQCTAARFFVKLRPFCTAPTMAARTRSRLCSSTPSSDQGLPSVSTLPPSCSPRSGGEETAAPLFATAISRVSRTGCFHEHLAGENL